jgi:two-component system sensor histidine kinase KdpD
MAADTRPRTPLLSRLSDRHPPQTAGVLTAILGVAAATGAIYPLARVAPVVSLSVVYLPVVILIAAVWGLRLGLATSLLSAAAFNFFHLPPVGQFTIADSRNWVALGAFVVVAVAASAIGELARARSAEAERGRAEADLTAAMARELLGGADTRGALATASHRLAAARGVSSAAIRLGVHDGDERHRALALSDGTGAAVATLLVPRGLPVEVTERLRRIAPGLGALVAIALRRDELQAEAVKTEALRRSDGVKTALLRAVSHDLRTPLTAIVATGHALRSASLTEADRAELARAVIEEGERLGGLVEQLLDLSRLQAGSAAPRREWVAVEDIVDAALDSLPGEPDVRVSIDERLPEIRGDAAQLERAIANLLQNAVRASPTVSLTARASGGRIVISVADHGPGIPAAELDRIFEPFYRGSGTTDGPGSGLGLAIARGFVEAGGGTITVESLPGQGATFVVTLPCDGAAVTGIA